MKKKSKLFFFISIELLVLIFIVFLLPTYIQAKRLGYNGTRLIWINIDSFIKEHKILDSFFWRVIHKIPESSILPVSIINIGILIFGFINYKKKWWYYIILLISILISVMLIDCWWILYTAE